jgi:tRNA A37 methylthiotransferase MiaB
VQLVREVGFDRVNTAAYSPRPNTPAAEWDNQVADLVKADRLNRLNAVVNEVAEERAQRFQGAFSSWPATICLIACRQCGAAKFYGSCAAAIPSVMLHSTSTSCCNVAPSRLAACNCKSEGRLFDRFENWHVTLAGRTVEVLVEGPNPRDPTQAMGRTRHNKLCFFPGSGTELKGSLVNVKVEAIRAYTLTGTIVGQAE